MGKKNDLKNDELTSIIEDAQKKGVIPQVSIGVLTRDEIDGDIDVNMEYAILLNQINKVVETSITLSTTGEPAILMLLERLFNIKLKAIDSIAKHQLNLKDRESLDISEDNEEEVAIKHESYIESLRKKRKNENEIKYGIKYGDENGNN